MFEKGKYYRFLPKCKKESQTRLDFDWVDEMDFIFTRSKWKVKREDDYAHVLFENQPINRYFFWSEADFVEVRNFEDLDIIEEMLND